MHRWYDGDVTWNVDSGDVVSDTRSGRAVDDLRVEDRRLGPVQRENQGTHCWSNSVLKPMAIGDTK